MKKITLLLLLQTIFSFAQDFKTPYEKGEPDWDYILGKKS